MRVSAAIATAVITNMIRGESDLFISGLFEAKLTNLPDFRFSIYNLCDEILVLAQDRKE